MYVLPSKDGNQRCNYEYLLFYECNMYAYMYAQLKNHSM